MSRSQRSRSKKFIKSPRLAQTQPNPEVANDSEDENVTDVRFLDTEQKGDLVKKLVIYVLQNATIKTPIKRTDIIKHVLNGQTSLFNEIFRYARTKLKTIYGIKLTETNKTNTYICIKTFPTSFSFLNAEGQTRFSLLFMIISYVFMKGGKITQSQLKEYLNSFDIGMDNDRHDVFGNIKKLIEEFTKQLYLTKTVIKVETSPEEVIEYSWGERSELEFDKKVLLDKVASLLKKPAVCFMEQYSKAYENDGSGDAFMDVSQESDSDE